MIITNKKKFDEICTLIHSMCKWNKKNEFKDLFFIQKNKIICTDGIIIIIYCLSDCAINEDCFIFPYGSKLVRYVNMVNGQVKMEVDKTNKFQKINFNMNSDVILDEIKKMNKRSQSYDFSEYEFRLPCDKKSTITFYNNGKVTFLFDVDFELKATYSDVAVNDNFFDDSQLDIIGGTYFLNGIYPLLKIEKKFVYEEYDDGNSAIKTKNFIVFLPKIQ